MSEGKVRTAPTAEQKAASEARRAAQAAEKAAKQTRRVPGAATPWLSHVKRGPAVNAGVSLAAAGGATYLLHRRRDADRAPVAKANHKTDAALGAVAGAGAADAALTVGGQATKAALTRQRERLGTSPQDDKVWADHKAKHGVTGRSDASLPNHVKVKMHADYPKELPGWRAQRALAFKNKPGVTGAVIGSSALAGAAIARHHAKKVDAMSKADDNRGKKDAAATVVGGAAGQGAYQATGYGTKHYVDAHTRKGGRGVTSAQVNRQDKVLKPLKSKFGMRNPQGHPERNNKLYHRNYPRELPYGTHIRTLGHTHEGKLGMATGAAATAVGAASAFGIAHHHGSKQKEQVGKADGDRKRNVVLPTVGSLAAAGGAAYADHRTDAAGRTAQQQLHHVGTLGRQANELEHQHRAGHNVGANMSEVHTLARRVEDTHVGALKGVARNGKIAGHLESGSAVLGAVALANHAHNKRRKKTPVAKAYQPGLITYHQKQADIHGRKSRNGKAVATAGGLTAAGSVAAHVKSHELARNIRGAIAGEGAARHTAENARSAAKIRGAAKVGTGLGAAALVGGGAYALHHGRKRDHQEQVAQGYRHARNAEVAERDAEREHKAMYGIHKSAFGVEHDEISKLGPPKVHVRETDVVRDKKRKTITYKPDTVETKHTGKTFLLRRDKYEAHALPGKYKPKDGDIARVSPRYQINYGDAKRIHQAHQDDAKHITFGSGETLKHRRAKHDVAKGSAFGVEHEGIEKFAIGEALEAGRDALRGLKSGLGGEVGPSKSAAGMQGKTLGLKTRTAGMKLKPMVNTPKRAAAVAGGAGLTGGYMLGTKNS